MDAPRDISTPACDAEEPPSFRQLVAEELAGPHRTGRAGRQQSLVPVADLDRLLPRFEQFAFLGAGGMGIVYKAWQPDLRRWVAVKLLAPDLAEDSRVLERFRNEASILAQLRHPNIVPIHDFGAEGDLAFLVMEYVEGVSLKTWAEEQKPNARAAAAMMARIARAAGVAHASGITHRDLKPNNILITADQQPVIIDFGLAQHAAWQQTNRFTQTGELAGTVAYLAPEQVDESLGEVCPATDVHACGVMAFEILTGSLPRQGVASQIIARLQNDEFPPRLRLATPRMSPDLEAICWKAMQKDPRDRYETGAALAEDFERFTEGLHVLAKRPGALGMAWLSMRRRPALSAAMVSCVTAVLVAGWSARQSAFELRKSHLITQINRSLIAKEWTPARLEETQTMLTKFAALDPAYAQHLRNDMVDRTASAVSGYLDYPLPKKEEAEATRGLVDYLTAQGHPQAAGFAAIWQARQGDWQTVARLEVPMTREAAAHVFPDTGWTIDGGRLKFDDTSIALNSRVWVQECAQVDAEFEGEWRDLSARGFALRVARHPDLSFLVFNAGRFRRMVPEYENKQELPVMAIQRGSELLAYETLPSPIANADRLRLRVTCEGGQLAMEANESARIEYTAVFMRSLPPASIEILLPAKARLVRLAVKQRPAQTLMPSFSTADGLVALGRIDAALPIYEQYLNRADAAVEARYKHGCCLQALGRTVAALDDWKIVAGVEQEPWRSLACLQLWRACITAGNMSEGNAWFDLLTDRQVPLAAKSSLTSEERFLLNRSYFHVPRSLNCLKTGPQALKTLERALAVQKFLAGYSRANAARIAPAFHFAGHDERARQMLASAIAGLIPEPDVEPIKLSRAVDCLDQWAALGDGDKDELLQANLTAWGKVLQDVRLPERAVPLLESVRRDLRTGVPPNPRMNELLEKLAADAAVMPGHRAEALLVAGFAFERSQRLDEARLLWQRAVETLNGERDAEAVTQPMLNTELVARGLAQAWDAPRATAWLTAVIAKAKSGDRNQGWTDRLGQSMAGESLAAALNTMFVAERGHRLARDYALRQRPARDLAREGLELFFEAVLRAGTALPPAEKLPYDAALSMAAAFCEERVNEAGLLHFFTLWNGVKNAAAWDALAKKWPREMHYTIASILEHRFRHLGQAKVAALLHEEVAALSGSQ